MTRPEQIRTRLGAPATASYSQAMRVGDTVYLGGHVGIDGATGEPAPDFEGQVRLAFQNLALTLEAAGSDLEHVVQLRCYLTDLSGFPTFDRVFREFFADPFPARATLGVTLGAPLLFELEGVAVVT